MMENTEIIKALRYCGNFEDREGCDEGCPYFNDKDCPKRIMCDAADALEELQQIADNHEQTAKDYWKEACEYKQRIAELEKQAEHTDQVDAMNLAVYSKQVARIAELEGYCKELEGLIDQYRGG